ncbi:hypothetical protein FOXG_14746 [Fusarium oxysporum f. sp. lycopersici 4287]|uniref:Uncharacterized protein n=2 Tax=Fusarium oxysporum TaxID=5507 RepID=A0A0J9VZZ4_FUSO4|nr:hypothetical protein FOXG_14746 [Fusarium oxysporum f. sp. lycopersici 4287]KNB16331.1 hypothetical protein FOXG_14746 [Fusarium oxysporum f. sp. lycopersici 4287]
MAMIRAAAVKVINPYIEHLFCIRQIGEHGSRIESCGSVKLPAQRFFDHYWGAAPTSQKIKRAADVAASTARKGIDTVIEYDFRRMLKNQEIESPGFLNQ